MITIIVAVCKNRAIGRRGDLIHHLRGDMRHFKELTVGHPVIMGRKTFESLPKGALPERRNIVVTRNRQFTAPGIETAPSLVDALKLCSPAEDIFIIGGASIYSEAIEIADKIELTEIATSPDDADTFFPEINPKFWALVSETDWHEDEKTGIKYRFLTYGWCPPQII